MGQIYSLMLLYYVMALSVDVYTIASCIS